MADQKRTNTVTDSESVALPRILTLDQAKRIMELSLIELAERYQSLAELKGKRQ